MIQQINVLHLIYTLIKNVSSVQMGLSKQPCSFTCVCCSSQLFSGTFLKCEITDGLHFVSFQWISVMRIQGSCFQWTLWQSQISPIKDRSTTIPVMIRFFEYLLYVFVHVSYPSFRTLDKYVCWFWETKWRSTSTSHHTSVLLTCCQCLFFSSLFSPVWNA